MEELNWAFSEYVEEFKKSDTKRKEEEILRSIRELIAIFEELGKIDNIDLEHLQNSRILDDNDDNNDFLDKEFILLEDAKNLIGQYLDKRN